MCIGNARLQTDGDQLDEMGEVQVRVSAATHTLAVVVVPLRHRSWQKEPAAQPES